MTKPQYRKLAGMIAKGIGAVKSTVHVGTWLGTPGVSIVIHLDKKPAGRRYDIHNVIGRDECTIRLIDGDARPGRGPFSSMNIGTVTFDSHAIVELIKPMPESEYCAHCRRSVDRDTDALERFNDGTILHLHCAEELRDEDQLPPLWDLDCNGLNTHNQVAVTNGKETIVLANLARFEKGIFCADLWNAAYAFATAYAAALNSEIEEN